MGGCWEATEKNQKIIIYSLFILNHSFFFGLHFFLFSVVNFLFCSLGKRENAVVVFSPHSIFLCKWRKKKQIKISYFPLFLLFRFKLFEVSKPCSLLFNSAVVFL